MPEVITINPEEAVDKSSSNNFQILFQTDREVLSWTRNGFHNIDYPSAGFLNIQVFKREEVVKEYYTASYESKTLQVGDGILHLVELPF